MPLALQCCPFAAKSKLVSLNPEQRAAVHYLGGPLLVLAGAGSGKTRVITEKIAELLRSGHQAERIAAITFTNKAAREMRERVAKLISKEAAESLQVSTFHALGLRFLSMEHAAAGLRRGFTVLDADDSFGILKDLSPKAQKSDFYDLIRQLIGRAKDEGLTPEQALKAARSPRELQAAEIYQAYQQRLQTFNAVDFDDLIALPERVLREQDAVRLRWREKLSYVLVDEYQDTNRTQYRLLKELVGPRGAFTAVGDDDQSIYAWRGANPENLNQLTVDYPNLKVIKLEQNYRCSGRILRCANAVIGNNPHLFEKRLWSAHGEGDHIRILNCRDDQHEAERIAAEIVFKRDQQKALWSDFAILYRGNHQARALEQALRLARVPYHLSGGQAFFDRAEVRDVLAYLRLIANPDDDAAFLRAVQVPKREIGTITLEKLATLAGSKHVSLLKAAESIEVQKQLAARPGAQIAEFAGLFRHWRDTATRMGAGDLTALVIQESGYAQHLVAGLRDPESKARREENMQELVRFLRESDKGRDGLSALANQLALISFSDRDDPGNAVRLSTLHASKGLEFRHVWLVGIEDGNLPHQGAIDEGRLEEERRLFYVGITRAKESLTMSVSQQKKRFGEMERLKPSRFLRELPEIDVRQEGDDPEREAEEKRERNLSHFARIADLLK